MALAPAQKPSHPSPAASTPRVTDGRGGILRKLRAAKLTTPRAPEVIRADIERVTVILKRLKNEHLRACSRERMSNLRTNPAFLKKRLEGSARASADPDLQAKRRANMLAASKALMLPPLSDEEYKLYHKYRWGAARMTREAALQAILGRP